jgi:ketosteroid isomerase-like protein
MRYAVTTFSVLCQILVLGCQQAVDTAAEKSTVKAVLDSYVTSVENEDMDLYSKTVAHDTAMVNFGTDGQPIVGWEALKKVMADQNAALSQTKITVSSVSIIVPPSGELAWATTLWNFKAKMRDKPIELPVRCTWVLEKRANSWVIVHFHKSVPTG